MPNPSDALIQELHDVAHRLLKRDEGRHSIVTGELFNQAWLRLARSGQEEGLATDLLKGRFVKEMRRELVDRAKKRKAQKRQGGRRRVQLDQDYDEARVDGPLGTLVVDDALETLEALNPRQAQVVEYRIFCGLTHEQIAEHLGYSEKTVRNDWRHARAWLKKRLQEETDGGA